MTILKAKQEHIPEIALLATELWPGHTAREMEEDCAEILEKGGVFFLALEEAEPAAFAQCQLRYDYVEGTDHSPVGYLEGVYVRPGFRGKGLARELVTLCEKWARERGCGEFASDCEVDNVDSLHFHLRCGFAEANRIICFAKKL